MSKSNVQAYHSYQRNDKLHFWTKKRHFVSTTRTVVPICFNFAVHLYLTTCSRVNSRNVIPSFSSRSFRRRSQTNVLERFVEDRFVFLWIPRGRERSPSWWDIFTRWARRVQRINVLRTSASHVPGTFRINAFESINTVVVSPAF